MQWVGRFKIIHSCKSNQLKNLLLLYKPVIMKTIYTLFFCFMMALSYSQETTTIYIIRHAEKAGNDKDSGLTDAGKERAKKWAEYFKDKSIETFYFTSAKRTFDTGSPTMINASMGNKAEPVPGTSFEIHTQSYDPATVSLKDIANKYKGENILLVGHSNTIAGNINTLIGENKYKDIPESEYSNLYIIKITGDKVIHEAQKI